MAAGDRGSKRMSDGVSEGTVTADDFEATKLYYRIGEVSRLTGVKTYVLRYWETEFKWMSPQKSRSKQRLYRPKDIEMIFLIKKLLYEQRFTIAGARKRLREMGIAGPTSRDGSAQKAPTSAREALLGVKDELLAIRAML